MAFISVAKVLWLLFMMTRASASQQYTLNDYAPEIPYICNEEAKPAVITYPPCCKTNSRCSRLCPGWGVNAVNATNAAEVFGTVNVALDCGRVVTIQALADLTTRRNFITSTLVKALELKGIVEKLPDIDVHSVDIFNLTVIITTFVPLRIFNGIDNRFMGEKIFEIIPKQKTDDSRFVFPDLIIGLGFLQDAGALVINQAIFTSDRYLLG